MRKFHFKFATVLEVRKSQEDEALRALGTAQGIYQEQINLKAYYRAELEKSLRRREQLGGVAAVQVSAFHTEDEYIFGTKHRIFKSDQAILKAKKNVEKALRIYLTARKKSRILEALQDKAYQEYRRETLRKEQKEIDDLNIMRYRLKEEVA